MVLFFKSPAGEIRKTCQVLSTGMHADEPRGKSCLNRKENVAVPQEN